VGELCPLFLFSFFSDIRWLIHVGSEDNDNPGRQREDAKPQLRDAINQTVNRRQFAFRV